MHIKCTKNNNFVFKSIINTQIMKKLVYSGLSIYLSTKLKTFMLKLLKYVIYTSKMYKAYCSKIQNFKLNFIHNY